MGTTIQIRRELAIAVAATLVLALLAVAFLLGRASVRAPQAEPLAEVAAAPPANVVSAPVAAPVIAAPQAENVAPYGRPTDVPPAPPAEGDLRAAVARYFSELDAVEATAKRWTDPQALAQEIVQQGLLGSTRGFDELVATERQARDRVAAMAVPAPCREHHAAILGLLDEAVTLLGRVKQALASQDIGALEGGAVAAKDLETRSRKVDELGASLRRQYLSAP